MQNGHGKEKLSLLQLVEYGTRVEHASFTAHSARIYGFSHALLFVAQQLYFLKDYDLNKCNQYFLSTCTYQASHTYQVSSCYTSEISKISNFPETVGYHN